MSLAAEVCSVMVPVTGEPGSVIVTLGGTLSTLNAAWCPQTRAEAVDVATAFPVAPGGHLDLVGRGGADPGGPTSPRSLQLPGGV